MQKHLIYLIYSTTLSVQDMASGDKYATIGKSKTGFNIAFQNSSGTGISRTFDYVAKGV